MKTPTRARVLAIAILLSACGPGATSTTSKPAVQASDAPTAAAPAQTAKATAGAAAKLGADAACRLVTIEEVGAAFGVTGLKAEPSPASGMDDGGGAVQYDCWYRTSGSDAVLALTYTVVSATLGMTADDMAAALRGSNATKVPGVDGAWDNGKLVVILRTDRLVVMQLSSSPDTTDKHAVLVQKLAGLVTRRM